MCIGFGAFNSSKTPSFGAATSPFGSSSGVSSSPLFGVSSTPASGAFSHPPTNTPMLGSSSRSTLFDAPSISASPASISPLFGAPCTHASKSPLFGAPNTPAPGASDSPLFGGYKTTASGTSNSPLFGSASSTPAFGASNSPLFGASISDPLFDASNKLAFGASRSSLLTTFGTPYEVPNKSVFGASSNPFVARTKPAFTSCICTFRASSNPGYAACRSCSNMSYNASNPPFITSTPFPLQQSSDPASKACFGSPFGASGKPVTGTSSFDAFTGTTTSGFDSSNNPAVSLRTTPFPLQQSSDPASKACFGSPFGASGKPVTGTPSFDAFTGTTTSGFDSSNNPAVSLRTTPFPLQQSSDPASKACFGSPFGASGKPVTGTPSFDAFTGTTTSGFDSSNNPAVSLRTTPFPLQQSSDPASKACFGSPFGASGKPVTGTPSFDAFTGTTISEFDSLYKPAVSLRTTPFPLQQSSDPASKAFGSPFGASGKPVLGTPSFDAFTGTTVSGFDSSNKPAVSLRISPFGGFQTCSFKKVSDACSCFGKHLSDGFTSWSPFWKDPVRLASFPLLAPTKSGCQQKEESPAVAYKPLYNYQDENQHILYMSISAVLAKENINMSHDELRWIEYSRRNGKGAASNKSADHVFQIKSTNCNAESDLISIKIEVPSRVAIQLLDAFNSLAIN